MPAPQACSTCGSSWPIWWVAPMSVSGPPSRHVVVKWRYFASLSASRDEKVARIHGHKSHTLSMSAWSKRSWQSFSAVSTRLKSCAKSSKSIGACYTVSRSSVLVSMARVKESHECSYVGGCQFHTNPELRGCAKLCHIQQRRLPTHEFVLTLHRGFCVSSVHKGRSPDWQFEKMAPKESWR